MLSQMALDIKAILQKSFYAQKLLDADIDKRAEVRLLMEKVTPTLSDMPRVEGSSNDKMCTALIRLEELDYKIAVDIKKLTDVIEFNRFLIDSLDNYNHRILLTKRYVNCERWEKIANDMKYSWFGIHRIHRQALECLAKSKIEHTMLL